MIGEWVSVWRDATPVAAQLSKTEKKNLKSVFDGCYGRSNKDFNWFGYIESEDVEIKSSLWNLVNLLSKSG